MKILSAIELAELAAENSIDCRYSIADRNYVLVTRKYFETVFANDLKVFIGQFDNWQEEVYDCDDIVRMAAAYAQWINSKTQKQFAVAIGEFWYQSAKGGHAILIAVCENNELLFLEPQTCKIVNLTKEEISTCVMLRF